MARSVLLQIARDSIEEVLQAKRIIDVESLSHAHSLLQEHFPLSCTLYLENEVRGFYSCDASMSLIEALQVVPKRAAFESENFAPLGVLEYLRCELELTLETDEGTISEKDKALVI